MPQFRFSDNTKIAHSFEATLERDSWLDAAIPALQVFRQQRPYRKNHQGDIKKDIWTYGYAYLHIRHCGLWLSTLGVSACECEHSEFQRFIVAPRSPEPLAQLHELDREWLESIVERVISSIELLPQLRQTEPQDLEKWCEANGYTDPFKSDGRWWAFPENAVMAVPVRF